MFRQVNFARHVVSACAVSRASCVAGGFIKPVSHFQHTAARFKSEKVSLPNLLSEEIVEEQANTEIDQEFLDIKKQILKTFKITDVKGEGIVKLHSVHRDEKIEIMFDCQDEAEDASPDFDNMTPDDVMASEEDGQEAADFGGINFTVFIRKADSTLLVNCIAGGSLQIENVQYLPPGVNMTDSDAYAGPKFENLNETVIEAFYDYLEERKIDGDMASFIASYAGDKEQREYVNWLHKVLAFTTTTKTLK